MPTSHSLYLGDLRVSSTHTASGNTLLTDAPVDNSGKGEAFSPTDLLATSLASCMMTIMGIRAARLGIEIKGIKVNTTKHMQADPRKVREIEIEFIFPSGLNLTATQKKVLEEAAKTCPVALSLHPDLVQRVSFRY